MRSTEYRSHRTMVNAILILNAIIFVIHNVLQYYRIFPFEAVFALSLRGLGNGFVWQLITFQFLHSGVTHLLFNLLAIYFFGRPMEDALGKSRFLSLYLLCGFVGGAFQMIGALLWPSHFGQAVMGASAGAFGLVAAFATLFPEQPLTMLLAFVFPIEMRAKFLLLFSGLLAIFGVIVPNDNIAHAAHLGGMITGIFYIRLKLYAMSPISLGMFRRRKPAPRVYSPPPLVKAKTAAVAATPWRAAKPEVEENLPPDEFISREVDPILDKISAHGIQSLTERERKILEKARAKMARR